MGAFGGTFMERVSIQCAWRKCRWWQCWRVTAFGAKSREDATLGAGRDRQTGKGERDGEDTTKSSHLCGMLFLEVSPSSAVASTRLPPRDNFYPQPYQCK